MFVLFKFINNLTQQFFKWSFFPIFYGVFVDFGGWLVYWLVMKFWTLVMAQPRLERVAQAHLEKQGFEVYFPLTRREKIVKQKTLVEITPLFPRYVFVKVPEIRWHSLKTTRGVSRVVFSGDKPAKISDKVVDDLKTHEIWLQEPEKFKATYTAGQPVKVISGAFLGHLGIFEHSTPNDRECILLNLLGREARVYVSTHDLVAC